MALVKVKPSSPLKIAGGAILLVASVSLMLHRMPKRGFVEAIADKPRPATSPDSSPTPPPAPAAAQPVAVSAVHHQSKQASSAPEAAPAPATPLAPAEPVDLTYECRSEAAILCYNIPARGLPRCLQGYDDALMRPCRHALKNFRSPGPSIDDEEPDEEPGE